MLRHIIIDDVMTIEDQEKLHKVCRYLNWLYDKNTVKGDNDPTETDDVYDVGQLVSPIFGERIEEQSVCPVRAVHPILRSIDYHLRPDEEFKHLLINRVKFNLLWRVKEAAGRWNTPHRDVDNPDDFISAVYYVKDADGDTVLFYPDETVRVKPKQGRVLVFPSTLLHASSSPVESHERIVINMVLKFKR